jgi:hypothetical protein
MLSVIACSIPPATITITGESYRGVKAKKLAVSRKESSSPAAPPAAHSWTHSAKSAGHNL